MSASAATPTISAPNAPQPDIATKTTWHDFIKRHFHLIAATDFFTVELLTLKGLKHYHVLFTIDLQSRFVSLLGIKHKPNGNWMQQIACNLTDPFDSPLKDKRYLIHDRDPLFTIQFQAI